MIGYDSPIPALAVLCWFLLGSALLVFTARSQRRRMPGGQLALLTGLRFLALLLAGAVLLNPFLIHRKADPGRFKVLVLGDASASMTTRDMRGGQARLEAVRHAFRQPEGLRAQLEETWQTEAGIFAEEVYPLNGGDFSVLPGRTALGTVLQTIGEQADALPLGALLVVSDGNSNHGRHPAEAARMLGKRGIPVNTVGVGAESELRDVSVEFDRHAAVLTPGEELQLPLTLRSNLPKASEIEVRLEEGGKLVDSRRVALGGEQSSADLHFTLQPLGRGHHVYRAVIDPPEQDRRPETDADYAKVEVKKAEHFRILYLGAHLGWQYPFLRRLSEAHGQMEISSVLRAGESVFLRKGELPDTAPADGFPESLEVFAEFDVVLLDTRVFAHFSPAGEESLRRFVDRRGGGLLAMGPGSLIPGSIGQLLPVTATMPVRVSARAYMELDNPEVLAAGGGSPLTVPPGPWIPAGASLAVARDQKPGARTVFLLSGNDSVRPVLSAQFYGSGRTAWFGLQSDWRWALSSRGDQARYRAFWSSLVGWLGAGTKPRVELNSHGSKAAAGEAFDLTVSLRDRNYEPASSARVRFAVAAPDGRSYRLDAAPTTDGRGRFSASFTPVAEGEYPFTLQVTFADGESMTRRGYFLALPSGDERSDVRYRPDILRDVARSSGGRFFPSPRAFNARELALSPALPTQEARRELLEQGWWLALLLGVLGIEWYLRRRIGLR